MKDVIVIGGGPSGAHFAYEASKKGYSVVLVDSKLLGRHKCCAGGLSGRFLEAYDVPDKLIERKITGIVLISPVGERAELDFEKTVSVTMNRATFDKWLVESAIDNGTEAVLGSGVKNLLINKDAVGGSTDRWANLSFKIVDWSIWHGSRNVSNLENSDAKVRDGYTG